jgi:hypothetical protein
MGLRSRIPVHARHSGSVSSLNQTGQRRRSATPPAAAQTRPQRSSHHLCRVVPVTTVMTSGTLAVSLVGRQEHPVKIFWRHKLPRFPAFAGGLFRLALAHAASGQGSPQGSSCGSIDQPGPLPCLPAGQVAAPQQQAYPALRAAGGLCCLGHCQPLFVRRCHNHAPECIGSVRCVKPTPTEVFASRRRAVRNDACRASPCLWHSKVCTV